MRDDTKNGCVADYCTMNFRFLLISYIDYLFLEVSSAESLKVDSYIVRQVRVHNVIFQIILASFTQLLAPTCFKNRSLFGNLSLPSNLVRSKTTPTLTFIINILSREKKCFDPLFNCLN